MRKKSKLKMKKGFSLVELLAVVVILGLLAVIGIVATNTLVDKAKKDKMDSQKNTVTLAAQTYMQNNKNLVPKVIGETSVIKISDLRATKYLTEDIKNEKGESCMEKSFVRVYKLSNTEYTYTTFLYCGSEEVPANEIVPAPKISAKFSDSSGDVLDDKLNNVSDAYLYVEINAATDEEIASYKGQGTQISIDGYSFKIFTYKGTEKTEAYNSGSLSGGKEEKIIINKKLQDYIDVTGVTEISIEVIAINTLGGIANINTTKGEHNPETDKTIYDDNVRPKCIKPDNPYNEGDWLNKSEYNLTKDQRKLTVGCDDGTGSGCIRNYFTMSWPNDDDKYGAEYVYIEVKDNAGNVSELSEDCIFRVNVDIKTPEATVTAYSGERYSSALTPNVTVNINGINKVVPSNPTHILANKIVGKPSILSKSVKVNDSKTKAIIDTTDYKNLIANTTEVQWMNNENYPDGVVYRIDLIDNIRLDKWTWETNEGYLNDNKAKKYKAVNINNPDGASGSIAQDEDHGKTIYNGSTNDTIFVQFVTEGMRYGVFTIYDKAGNSTKIEIAANLDRTPPPVPSNIIAYQYNKVREEGTTVSKTKYEFGTWINKYVQAKTAAGQNRDDLTAGVTLSGFWQFYYDARNNANTRVGTSDYATNALGVGIYNFKGTAKEVDGKNKIRFMGCDKAGNCSDWSAYKDVWIDITVPKCSVEKTITKGAESVYKWLGDGETARVTATCTDPTQTLASGCTVPSFHHDYNYQINTNKAGAAGNGNGGTFTDHAGNTVTCPAGERIQIDYQYPECTVSGGSSSWTNKSRTVTGKCSDKGGSECVTDISHTYNYDIETYSGGAAGNNKGGSVTDKADNVTKCPANQTVKVDRTMPYVTASIPPGVYDIDEPGKINVTLTCNDDLSGLSSKFDKTYSVSFKSPIEDFGVGKCCIDNAGNEMCDRKGEYSARIYGRHSSCGVESYYSCRTSGCGVERYNRCSACGCETYSGWSTSTQNFYVGDCGQCTYKSNPCSASSGTYKIVTCDIIGGSISGNRGYAVVKQTTKTRSCNAYNRCSSCTVDLYNNCENSACGVKKHKICWHYGADCACNHSPK